MTQNNLEALSYSEMDIVKQFYELVVPKVKNNQKYIDRITDYWMYYLITQNNTRWINVPVPINHSKYIKNMDIQDTYILDVIYVNQTNRNSDILSYNFFLEDKSTRIDTILSLIKNETTKMTIYRYFMLERIKDVTLSEINTIERAEMLFKNIRGRYLPEPIIVNNTKRENYIKDHKHLSFSMLQETTNNCIEDTFHIIGSDPKIGTEEAIAILRKLLLEHGIDAYYSTNHKIYCDIKNIPLCKELLHMYNSIIKEVMDNLEEAAQNQDEVQDISNCKFTLYFDDARALNALTYTIEIIPESGTNIYIMCTYHAYRRYTEIRVAYSEQNGKGLTLNISPDQMYVISIKHNINFLRVYNITVNAENFNIEYECTHNKYTYSYMPPFNNRLGKLYGLSPFAIVVSENHRPIHADFYLGNINKEIALYFSVNTEPDFYNDLVLDLEDTYIIDALSTTLLSNIILNNKLDIIVNKLSKQPALQNE